jgi:hypothetical protein
LSQAQFLRPVAEQGWSINLNRSPTQNATFEPGTPEAGPYPLNNQIPRQLGNRRDDHNDSPAEGAAGVEIFAERHELDTEMVQCVEHFAVAELSDKFFTKFRRNEW